MSYSYNIICEEIRKNKLNTNAFKEEIFRKNSKVRRIKWAKNILEIMDENNDLSKPIDNSDRDIKGILKMSHDKENKNNRYKSVGQQQLCRSDILKKNLKLLNFKAGREYNKEYTDIKLSSFKKLESKLQDRNSSFNLPKNIHEKTPSSVNVLAKIFERNYSTENLNSSNSKEEKYQRMERYSEHRRARSYLSNYQKSIKQKFIL